MSLLLVGKLLMTYLELGAFMKELGSLRAALIKLS
jgi:hypothetical protein